MPGTRYHTTGLGGTFDHFHKGHERFILFAAGLAKHLKIGVTTPKLIQKKPLASLCQDYETRATAVAEFCEKQKLLFKIIPLDDVYGPTLEDSIIDVLCVTKETLPGGTLINRTRKKRGLSELPINICEYYLDEFGRPLHSVDIRAGTVNRKGRVYERIFEHTIRLTQDQRKFFAKPQGRVINRIVKSSKEGVFVVGDATLQYFIQHNLPYQLGIYDKKINRVTTDSAVINVLKPDIIVEHTPGTISSQLAETIQLALQKKFKYVFVKGEEDTAAIVLVLLLPLNSLIYYGQPNKGMVKMGVTEKLKDRFYEILNSGKVE